MFKHIKDNKGDVNVSKMTMVAIVFVVGAILLVLTTSAFRSPMNRWFEKVTTGWFASENGMYEADNPFLGYEKNANGTYKGARYICYYFDGSCNVLECPEDCTTDEYIWYMTYYDNGNPRFDVCYDKNTEAIISEDGRTITIGTDVYVAYP